MQIGLILWASTLAPATTVLLRAPLDVDVLEGPDNWGSPRYDYSRPGLTWRDLSEQGSMGAVCDMNKNAEEECGKGLVCRAGVCRHCNSDAECPSLYRCQRPLAGVAMCTPESRMAWELAFTDPWEAFCTFLILLAATLSAAAGTGGGGIFVPVLISFSTLKAENAVPLSQCMCLCGAFVNVAVFISRRHPDYYDKPVIDYDIIMLFAPMLFLGVTLGVLLNQMSPQWLLLLLLMLTLGSAFWRTSAKGMKQLRQENALLAQTGGLHRQGSGASMMSEAFSEAVDALREYFDQVAELTNDAAYQVVGVLTVWMVMLGYSFFSTHPCTRRWAVSLFLLSMLLVGCTIGAARYIMRSATIASRQRSLEYSTDDALAEGRVQFRSKSPVALTVTPGMNEKESFMLGKSLLEADFLHRLQFPGVAFGAGFLGGLLGLGGGIILGPVLLEVGVHSEVVQACTASFVLLSSSLAALQFGRAGLVVWHYAVWYGVVTVFATYVGQTLCESFARKQKRYSFITLAIAGVLAASMISLICVGSRNVVQDFYMGKEMGFSSTRLCSGRGLRIIATDAAPATPWPADLQPYVGFLQLYFG